MNLPSPNLTSQLESVQNRLGQPDLDGSALNEIALQLAEFSELARDCSLEDLFQGAELLSQVSELAAGWDSGQDETRDELVGFVQQNVNVLGQALSDQSLVTEVASFVQLAREHWNEYLSLFDNRSFPMDDQWESGDEADHSEAEAELDGDQIKMMLAALGGATTAQPEQAATNDPDSAPEPEPNASQELQLEPPQQTEDEAFALPATSLDDLDVEARAQLAGDRELLEAYLDDALRCLASMEQAAMKIDQDPEDRETARQFCRELHTLKGASATVGLSGLASHLHSLESSLEQLFDAAAGQLDAEPLFTAVDRVRTVIDSLQNPAAPEPKPAPTRQTTSAPAASIEPQRPTSKPATDFSALNASDDASIRIRASKLDRLMDMLAELVVLRNRRESHVTEFNELNEELVRCAARVGFADQRSEEFNSYQTNDLACATSTMSEVSKDIAAVSQGLRELQKPVINDNAAISRFIRDFRQELMQLRRLPVSGLFSRLTRAARDAAKSEQKQVKVVVSGEHAGLEQEIQERLFDSLLHIIRNSVSHGIELPQTRAKAGKPEVGTIELEASSNAQLLVIEVRDDGGGIDHEAIRRRAVEKGLIGSGDRLSKDQLAKLIFHPGFSTRDTTSEISGRGVGMDVVATTIQQLRGRIEIDSLPRQGTTMRLLIPLRTGIEHVMVFRSGGQLFALPMQSVTAAKNAHSQNGEGHLQRVSLSAALSLRSDSKTELAQDILVIRRSSSRQSDREPTDNRLAVAVDELVGPEEVVVRKLPNLLRNHPLLSGITLSGSGEKVLLLDADRVLDFCADQELDSTAEATANDDVSSSRRRALVVDDSLTARKVLGKLLRQHGLDVIEAGDGLEALDQLHRNSFDLVLTDLDMPRMGGLELLSDMHTGDYCDAPRVVVSSRNEAAFRDQAIELGATEFINKPVSESTVVQLLEQLELLPENVQG